MSKLIKAVNEKLTEEMLKGLMGKFINVPTNPHVTQTPTGATGTVNAWFAGKVAGYEKAYVGFDYPAQEYYEEPKTYYQALLCDGMGYVLSDGAEIFEISEQDFVQLVADEEAKRALEHIERVDNNKEIFVPEQGITLPGEEEKKERNSRVVDLRNSARK